MRIAYLVYCAEKDQPPFAAVSELRAAMSDIDWNAIDFAQNAISRGEELFSCYPQNDVLVRYDPKGRTHDDRQQEFAF